MKNKKVLAAFMSLLIVLSSVTVGGFSVFAADHTVGELETLTEAYEQKMNGAAYTNMAAAYQAWYDAEAYLVGVEAGIASESDVDTYYNALNSAINNMGAWTAKTADAQPSFVDDSTGTAYDNFVNGDVDYAVNILYWPGCTNYSANGSVADVTIDLYYPTTVLMYDGINTPTMPVMALASKSTDSGRYIYQLYPSASASSSENNADFRLTENWHGSNGTANRTANWTWTMENGTNGSPMGWAGSASTNNRLELNRSGFPTYRSYVAALANGMQFTGSMDPQTYSRGYNLDWYRLSGDGADDSGYISNTNATLYVINYKAVLDAISSAGLANITSYSYAGATALLSAVQTCMDIDPNAYSYASDVAGAVSSCASAIQSAVAAVDAAKSGAGSVDIASYMTLASAYAEYADVYSAGQSNYTTDSWTAFAAEYEAAASVLNAVVNKTAYMSSASSDALVSAYSNLKEEVKDIEYTYNFADGSNTTVTAPEGVAPQAPANTQPTEWASNADGTHGRTVYSWPEWQSGVTVYDEQSSSASEECSLTVTEEAVEATRGEEGKTAVETCTVCGYKTGGEVIPALGVMITVAQNELGTTMINGVPTTGDAQKVAYDESYTLTAQANEGAEFIGWQVNGKLVSAEAAYTTTAYADTTYVPVFAEAADEFTVTFIDQFNKVVGVYTNAEIAEMEALPDAVSYLGYTFEGWSMTLEEVKALDTNAIVTASYVKSDVITYTVTAPGCTIIEVATGKQLENEAVVTFDTLVTVKPDSADATAWTVNGADAAYGAEYTFYVTADVDVAYSSDEVTAQPTVAAVAVEATENGARFLATRSVPDGYTLVESGFVYGKNVEDAETALVLENAGLGCYLYKNSNTAADGQFALTVNSSAKSGTLYARAYIMVADAEGEVSVYYADVQSYAF